MTWFDGAVLIFILWGEYILKASIVIFIGAIIYGAYLGFRSWKELKEIKLKFNSLTSVKSVELYFLTNGKWENSAMAKAVIKAGESKKAKMVARDSFGNEAAFEGAPKWSSMDDSKLELVPSEDGKECEVKSKGLMGEVKLQCLVDADLGEGVKEVIGEGDVEITAGDAVSVEVSFE